MFIIVLVLMVQTVVVSLVDALVPLDMKVTSAILNAPVEGLAWVARAIVTATLKITPDAIQRQALASVNLASWDVDVMRSVQFFFSNELETLDSISIKKSDFNSIIRSNRTLNCGTS